MDLNKMKWLLAGAGITLLMVLGYNNFEQIKHLASGEKDKFGYREINPEFAQYIAAFTTGYISSGSYIKIKFTSQLLESVPLNSPISDELFEFNENIEGVATWTDAQTIEFKPSKRMPAGRDYTCTFHLGKLVNVKDELRDFKFSFTIVKQSLKIEFAALKCYDERDFNYYRSSGVIYTADFAEQDRIESVLSAHMDGKEVKISWLHDAKNNTHRFSVDSIQRGNSMFNHVLNYEWNGKSLEVEEKGKKEFAIASKGVFKFIHAEVFSSPEQFVQLAFSNPLNTDQMLEGLISLGELKDIKFIVDNNFIRIYPDEFKTGTYALKLREGIRDALNVALGKEEIIQIKFEESKPKVNFASKGNILPSGNGLSIPFQAVNLKAVDVEIIKLYENNVLQFLQTNELDGDYQMARVGKTILEKTISLGITNPADFKQWKKFSLDLSSLIEAEPGAIYRVNLSFKKSYSTFPCGGEANTTNIELAELKEQRPSNANYAYYYDYYAGEYYEDYDWRERENPCNSAYYGSYETTVSKNILASDIGLTVKKSNDGNLFLAANHLVSTQVLPGLELEFYDYQQQLIETAKTNQDGLLFLNPKEIPYFIIAKRGKERAYLKLDDGTALPLTLFDTEGKTVEKGIKGFIYGERGVWRPGDTLFLSFMLEDKLNVLPANHPVLFELQNPRGIIYKKQLKTKGMDGIYTFPVATDVNVPTGNWTAICKVGAMIFTKDIRIETIMPNRLKIKVNVGDNKLVSAKAGEKLSMHVNWLTGANAGNLATSAELVLQAKKTEFPKYKQFVFDDVSVKYESEKITLFDGKLNAQGDIQIPFKINTKGNASGMLKANLVTRVYETGGAFSVDRFKFDYSPFANYVGIKLPSGANNGDVLLTDKKHEIEIATVNFRGQPVSVNRLKVNVYKLSWRWWWDQYEDEFANYVASDYHQPVLEKEVQSVNGKAKFDLNIKEADWGRYLIRVSDLDGGHSSATVAYFDYPNWMDRGGADNKIVASLLKFTTDRESYRCKEEVMVSIPSPKGGRALVTIETGSKILEAHWVETTKGNTKFKFTVSPEMAPNVYVHVSLIQPHAQITNDLPIRLYGVLPVKVDDPETHLRPVLKMPEVLAPETVASLSVAEENGKEMTYTIAVVDEGLLDLTRFLTPDPWSHFYAREALGTRTWDLYDYVIGAYGGELERILSIGGDGVEINRDAAKANRFKPMVKFLGPFHLEKGGRQTHSFKMPMYIGSVRTMLIARDKGAYGTTEKTTPVKSPIMLLATLPRVLSVQEELSLPVSVFGGDADLKNVSVSVETNGLLSVVGPASQVMNARKEEEEVLRFKLKVKGQTGIARIKVTAQAGSKKTYYAMEVDVRNPNPMRTESKDYFVEPGKELSGKIVAIGAQGSNSGQIELSSIPSIHLEERLNYLITYPHGCIEQTVSAAFPQLYLNDIVALSAGKKSEIEANIKMAINKLQKFQLPDGGFSYWPGVNEVSEWGTIYAGHFLFAAEKAGYSIPGSVKQNWVSYMKSKAGVWEKNKGAQSSGDFIQAYRLYALAYANKPVLSAMNLLREESNLSLQARWRLAGAYALINNMEAARKIIDKQGTKVNDYKAVHLTFGSASRDEAMILETLCLLDNRSAAFASMKRLSADLSGQQYMNTQATAYGLLSAACFLKKYGAASSLQAKIWLNNKEVPLEGNSAINVFKLDDVNKNGSYKIANKGKGVLYVRVISRGKPPIGEELEGEQHLSSTVVFRDLNQQIIQPGQLKQGTNFLMEVVIRNNGAGGDLQHVALLNYLPAGWEIHNSRMDENEAALRNSSYDYQDIRDDRVMTYFSIRANETKTYRFNLNASYAGHYYLPGINVEPMYDNGSYSRKKGQWIDVR